MQKEAFIPLLKWVGVISAFCSIAVAAALLQRDFADNQRMIHKLESDIEALEDDNNKDHAKYDLFMDGC